MLSASDTELYTSHPIGGVCPFGLPSNLTIYADKSLEDYGYVIPAAGSANSSIIIDRIRLINMVSAIKVDVTTKIIE